MARLGGKRDGGGPAGEAAGADDDALVSLGLASDEEMFAFIDNEL